MQHLRSTVLRAARQQLRRPVAARAFPARVATMVPNMMNVRSFASFPADDEEDFDYNGFDFGDDEEEDKVKYPAQKAFVGQVAPSFTAPAIIRGDIEDLSLESYRGKYVVLFFYPKDFTYVCPTEIIAFNDRAKEFEALDTQLICCSIDSPEVHLAWTRQSRNVGGLGKMKIPMVSDLTKSIAAKYGCLKEDEGIAFRGLYVIDREGIVQNITINNLPVGRSVDEVLRLVKAFQFNEEHGEVCPANWQPGEATIQANPSDSLKYFKNVK
ncbi:thioredoxin-dependent peroxide reductase [Achlya hypogyna]|uniref:thioredoxin-dependent peroxiredoxin n=1 Tax=Achlya hypogyna TaxID=1202772 RepID=A0A1V9ZMQ8_ACHHY|nr:thioredoxin-dependent peroxide reductase [Achlya hypogyna]